MTDDLEFFYPLVNRAGRPCTLGEILDEDDAVHADPNPMPRFDLFPRLTRLARWLHR